MKKFKKEIIASYGKYLDGEQFEVLVLDDGEYYNIHVISEKYNQDELNTLKLQETKACIDDYKTYFNNSRLISYLMGHFIWDRFHDEGIFCGSVQCEFENH
jgi:uncharacterized protein (DUF39 family)